MSASKNNQNLNQLASGNDSIMVGILFNDGVIIAITMTSHLIFYLDDRIYCCGRSTGYDHDSLVEVATELEEISSHTVGYKGALVAQALELLTKKYENLQDCELLLAGEDVCGLHLFTVTSDGYTGACFAALGPGADVANDYLANNWKKDMSLQEAESLVRRTIAKSRGYKAKVDLCIVFKSH
ncbi:uncharacterized protein LOC117568719 [Drosophila albomicans]|uniref:Uncharacterized protein LOC117568719 n=1 Tax=Drosophila albomicans TaxID=7291 RepID=A0A6P8YBT7_DROAB|nr:uncharacterized protein LOC117568719 [Drosophila albomicans]